MDCPHGGDQGTTADDAVRLSIMTRAQPDLTVTAIDDDAFLALAAGANEPTPIEQAPPWDAFDAAVDGRTHLGRVVVTEPDGTPVALASLTRYEVRGFPYVWARHAPIMLAEPTADRERSVRAAIASYVKAQWPRTVFVRLHAHREGSDLRPLLQTVTYDRTVRIDLTQDADAYLASLAKKFRYTVRQALGHADVTVADETDLTSEAFDELYAVYRETASRDGFGIYPASVYWSMIEALRPHARVYVTRCEGAAIAWAIITLYDGGATYYYAAASAKAREKDATVRLLWDVLADLRSRGATTFDMGGVDSPLAPTLAGVGLFKRKWGTDVAVAPAWDLPLRPTLYRGLGLMLKAKKALRS